MGLRAVFLVLAALSSMTFIGGFDAKTISESQDGDRLCAAYFNVMSDDGKDHTVNSFLPFSRSICSDKSVSTFLECSFKKNESCRNENAIIVNSTLKTCPEGDFFSYEKRGCVAAGQTICPANWLAKELPVEARKAVLSSILASANLVQHHGGQSCGQHRQLGSSRPRVTTITTITTKKSTVTTVITSVRSVTDTATATINPKGCSGSVTKSSTTYSKTVTTQPPTAATSVASTVDAPITRGCDLGTSVTTLTKVSTAKADKDCSSWTRRVEPTPPLPPFPVGDYGQHGCIDCTLDDCMRCSCREALASSGSDHAHINDPRQKNRWLQCQGQRTVCQPCPEGLVWNCQSTSCAAQGSCPDIPKVCRYVCGMKPPVTKVTTFTTKETLVVTTIVTTTKVTKTTDAAIVTPSTSLTPAKPSVSTKSDWVDHKTTGSSTYTCSGDYSIHPANSASNEICDTKNDFDTKDSTNHFVAVRPPPVTTITAVTTTKSTITTVIKSVGTVTTVKSTGKPNVVSVSVTKSPTTYTKIVTTQPPSSTTSTTSVARDCNHQLGTSTTSFNKVSEAISAKNCSSWTRSVEKVKIPTFPTLVDDGQHSCIDCVLDDCMRCNCREAMAREGSDHAHINDPRQTNRWLQCQGQRTVCQPCPEGLVWNCESKTCAAQGNCPDIPKVCWYVCGRIPPVKKVTTLTTMETVIVTTLLTTTKVTNTTAPIAVTPYTSTPSKPSTSTENTWVDHGLAGTSTSTTSGSYSVHPSYLVSNEICDTKNDVQCKNPTK